MKKIKHKIKTNNRKMQKNIAKNTKMSKLLCAFCFFIGILLGIGLYFFNIFLFKNFSVLINLILFIWCFLWIIFLVISRLKFKRKKTSRKMIV